MLHVLTSKLMAMRKEFMLYICNAAPGAKDALSAEQHLAFVQQCEVYINRLAAAGKLIGAQPLLPEGIMVSRESNDWATVPIQHAGKVQVGYYHIIAGDMEEAIRIAKENPEFDFIASASVEIRPVKTKEARTAFVYPAGESK